MRLKFNTFCNTYITSFTEEFRYAHTISLFRGSILIFLLLYAIQLLPVADAFLGPDNFMIPYYKSSNLILRPLNLLENPRFQHYYLWFLWGFIGCILAYFFLPFKRLWLILVYILLMNIYHKTAPLQNGGFSLLTIEFFMLLFVNENAVSIKNKYWRSFEITLSNFAFLAMRLQVIFLYLVASFYKLKGISWIDGTAFYYVLYNDMYAQPIISNAFIDNIFAIKAVSWFTLLFQLLFPFLVWLKKTKKIMIFAGVFFHLMIAWVMGIVDFGIIMILMYILFNSDDFN